jgi:hypothetical protein
MKFTLIVPDGTMAIDGEGYSIDVSLAPAGLHAVQWYETWGEEEWVDNLGRVTNNEKIITFDLYQWAIDAWNNAKAEFKAAIAARQQIIQSAEGETGPTVI